MNHTRDRWSNLLGKHLWLYTIRQMNPEYLRKGFYVAVLLTATARAPLAQTLTTLVNFDGSNGSDPQYGSLVQGPDGNLYGTTSKGGTNNLGTVFKVTLDGKLTTLHNFAGTDGSEPLGGLVFATSGAFYGTASAGGAENYGTIFEITTSGKLTTLYNFSGLDGNQPSDQLIQGIGGDFYGTTRLGGAYTYGTIFKISPAGLLTTLHNFHYSDELPIAPLVQASDGTFYGSTAGLDGQNLGTVFKLSEAGALTTLISFDGTDGAYPMGALMQASNGELYGTTLLGAPSGCNACGTVFQITPAGAFTVLDNLPGEPSAGLVQATDGNLYGTTSLGGADGEGSVYEMTLAGTLTTLLSFYVDDGAMPNAGLLQATDGNFYGTTSSGGAGRYGTIFRLSTGLGQFVAVVPVAGTVGSTVRILGDNLNSATAVSFNDTPATFTVDSATEISATVPSGAITGKIGVVLATGTVMSNVSFRVLR